MSELITLLEGHSLSSIAIIFILFVLIIIGIYETIEKLKGIFLSYHNKLSKEENKDISINDKLNSLKVKINEIEEQLDEISNQLERLQVNTNRSNRALSRPALNDLAIKLINKGWMSQTEYETLSELTDVYLMSASVQDGYVKPSLIQRALELKVLTEQEAEELKKKKSGSKE